MPRTRCAAAGPAAVALVGCGDLPADLRGGQDADDEIVLTLGKRSAPWPEEVSRTTDDGLVEVLETDAVQEEAWTALAPDELPTGGDPATTVEEGPTCHRRTRHRTARPHPTSAGPPSPSKDAWATPGSGRCIS